MLTDKERQALTMAANGMPVKSIADSCGVNANAIDKRLKSARVKLGAINTANAIAKAIKLGLIPLGKILTIAIVIISSVSMGDSATRVPRPSPRPMVRSVRSSRKE